MWNREHPLGFPLYAGTETVDSENIPLLKPETMDKYITVPLAESHLVALIYFFSFLKKKLKKVPSLFTFCIPGALETPWGACNYLSMVWKIIFLLYLLFFFQGHHIFHYAWCFCLFSSLLNKNHTSPLFPLHTVMDTVEPELLHILQILKAFFGGGGVGGSYVEAHTPCFQFHYVAALTIAFLHVGFFCFFSRPVL